MGRCHLLFIIGFLLSSCSGNTYDDNKVNVDLVNCNPQTIYLYRTAEFEESPKLMDSFVNDKLDVKFNFQLPSPDRKIYQLILTPYLPSIYFLNDTTNIKISANLNDFAHYQVEKSLGSQEFLKLHKYTFQKSHHRSTPIDDSQIENEFKGNEHFLYELAKNSSNPEFALFVVSQIHFEKMIPEWKTILNKFELDFPRHPAITRYILESKKIIDAYEREYEVGDTLPKMTLKDLKTGKNIHLSPDNKKIIIYDFFSVLQRSKSETENLKSLKTTYGENCIEILGFPVEPDSSLVLQYLSHNDIRWPHFSDFKGWQGEIISKYYIDSVPYLFISDSLGKITAKNLNSKKLNYVIKQKCKT